VSRPAPVSSTLSRSARPQTPKAGSGGIPEGGRRAVRAASFFGRDFVKPFTRSATRIIARGVVRETMSTDFTPIFLFLAIAVFTGLSMLALSALLGPRKVTAVKQMPYESGMNPIGDTRQRFDVRFYLVAIAFLLFDVELLYLYPWSVAQWSADPAVAAATAAGTQALAGVPPIFRAMVFWEIMVFIAILTAAFAYAWKKGVFEWR